MGRADGTGRGGNGKERMGWEGRKGEGREGTPMVG